MGYKRNHIQCRNDTWYYYRRVPKIYAQLDNRRFIKQSLHTDSETIAAKRAVLVNEATEQYWHDLMTHQADDAKEKYEATIRLARAIGFSYLPAQDLAKRELGEVLSRTDAIIDLDPHKIPEAQADALLGGVEKPTLKLNAALDEFWKLSVHEIRTKTDRERKKWENPRKRAVQNFIKLIGDKPLAEISRIDALDFRAWWIAKIETQGLTANAANKDIQHLSGIFRTVNDDLRLGLDNPFARLRLSEKNDGGTRMPFPAEYIQETLLDLNKLAKAGLSLEAQMLVFAAADTGCGVSELTGLDPNLGEINLDAEIPYIHIKANKHRALKVKHRDRQIPLVGSALFAFQQCPDGFSTYRGKADSASSWINRAMRDAELFKDKSHSLYSLRHSFQDRLTAIDIPDMIAAALMGHSYHRPRYGQGPSLELKQEWLGKIEFKVYRP